MLCTALSSVQTEQDNLGFKDTYKKKIPTCAPNKAAVFFCNAQKNQNMRGLQIC